MPKVLLSCFFLFLSVFGFSQNQYSLNALTGRGDLALVGDNFKLQKEVFEAFNIMKEAALMDGVNIEIVSAYRSFKRQKNIWNRKYDKFISKGLSPNSAIAKIIEYSTLPGTSRHHWGTDIDIMEGSVKTPNQILIESNYSENEIYGKLKKWMDANSEKFGFYLVYTHFEGRKGFKYEPWHYSYKPLSKIMLEEFKTIDLIEFYSTLKLKGTEFITKDFLEDYKKENVLDINPDLE
jgi:LAS superfamily LD-carboxypeptidase LdcB